MENTKKNNSFGVNVGTSSLLLVFVILCLVSFATLSVVSSNADKNLSSKVTEKSHAYYDACNEAELKLMSIDQTLKSVYDSGVTRDEYYEKVGETIDFAVAISDVQTLHIKASVNYPVNAGDYFYTITSWKVETTGSLVEEEEPSLNLLF